MKRILLFLSLGICISLAFAVTPVTAETLSFEFMGGDAYNFPTPLTVHQSGYPDIQFSANYDTEPFGPYTPYYAWRLSLWNGPEAWELEQVHHRLFLSNPPPEIQYFAIHFGYNYFLVGHAWRNGDFIFHLGIGPIIANPSNIVRGQDFQAASSGWLDQGYELAGVGAQVAFSRDFYYLPNAFIVVDVGLMGALASVPVANGSADVPNLSLHGHLGLGFSL